MITNKKTFKTFKNEFFPPPGTLWLWESSVPYITYIYIWFHIYPMYLMLLWPDSRLQCYNIIYWSNLTVARPPVAPQMCCNMVSSCGSYTLKIEHDIQLVLNTSCHIPGVWQAYLFLLPLSCLFSFPLLTLFCSLSLLLLAVTCCS